jgi:integrase
MEGAATHLPGDVRQSVREDHGMANHSVDDPEAKDGFEGKAFHFTEARCRQALQAVVDGDLDTDARGKRFWRDLGCPQLQLRVTRNGTASFYRVGRNGPRVVFQCLGKLADMRVADARKACDEIRANRTLAAQVVPSRRRNGQQSIGDAWQAYYDAAGAGTFIVGRKRLEKSTLQSYKNVYDPHLKPHADKSLQWLAESFRGMFEKLGQTKPAAANRFLQVVKNMFQFAAKQGKWSGLNPVIDPASGRPYQKNSIPQRERFLYNKEMKRLDAALDAEGQPWRDFFMLALLTGQRKGNIQSMRWSDIHLQDATWHNGTTKNGLPVRVPLVQEAVRILRERRKRTANPGEWVFPMRKDPGRHIEDADHAWSRIREAAKLPDVRIHDLRRTAGSWATQGGANMPEVGKLLGHKSLTSTQVYARADNRAARKAADLTMRRLTEALLGGMDDGEGDVDDDHIESPTE